MSNTELDGKVAVVTGGGAGIGAAISRRLIALASALVGFVRGGLSFVVIGASMFFAEISGLPAVSLQPAAGAHGEFTALMVAAAYFRERGERRTKVLAPDSAHGTNPASAVMACVASDG